MQFVGFKVAVDPSSASGDAYANLNEWQLRLRDAHAFTT